MHETGSVRLSMPPVADHSCWCDGCRSQARALVAFIHLMLSSRIRDPREVTLSPEQKRAVEDIFRRAYSDARRSERRNSDPHACGDAGWTSSLVGAKWLGIDPRSVQRAVVRGELTSKPRTQANQPYELCVLCVRAYRGRTKHREVA
jgi:hypothetical protein